MRQDFATHARIPVSGLDEREALMAGHLDERGLNPF